MAVREKSRTAIHCKLTERVPWDDTAASFQKPLARSHGESSPEWIHDQPAHQLWIKVGRFLRHAILCLRYLANLSNPCSIQQESYLGVPGANYLEGLLCIARIADIRTGCTVFRLYAE